ncbi:MAG TPA: hypothetical protein VMZ27_01020, partial [Candidatus Saccharimonadales bacterium]|nr:hypothetical protein [Candidatus Saccharimonadales bacterium]
SSLDFRGPGARPGDNESVALWNPDWKVTCSPFEGAPKKLVDYAGRRNVLMTHPLNKTTPAALERTIQVPKTEHSVLRFAVASDDKGDWELRVLVNEKLIEKRLVNAEGERWKQISVDLGSYAGQSIRLRLENAANDWSYEFGYWSDLQLTSSELRAAK